MSEKPKGLRHPAKRAMLLAALYVAQEQYGYLSAEAIERTAARLGLTTGEVYSTASFHTLFRTQPQGRYVVQICEGLCCFLAGGAEHSVDYIPRKLGIRPGETTSDDFSPYDQCSVWPRVAPHLFYESTMSFTNTRRQTKSIAAGSVGKEAECPSVLGRFVDLLPGGVEASTEKRRTHE